MKSNVKKMLVQDIENVLPIMTVGVPNSQRRGHDDIRPPLEGLCRRFTLVLPPLSLKRITQAWFLRLFLKESREIASASKAIVVEPT